MEVQDKIVHFNGFKCVAKISRYLIPNIPAIILYDIEDGQEVLRPTTNLLDVKLKYKEVFIKNYSENEGVLQALIDAGIISEPVYKMDSGFVELYICKLLV